MKNLYFAYGSNLSKEQMLKRCPECKPLYTGRLYNWTICYPSISPARNFKGVLGIRKAESSSFVEGLIYELSDKDLELLDISEGIGTTNNYKRVEVNVEVNGNIEKCFIYESVSDSGENYLPSYGYFSTVLYGMLDNKLSHEYIINTMKISFKGTKPSIKTLTMNYFKLLKRVFKGVKNTNTYFPIIK